MYDPLFKPYRSFHRDVSSRRRTMWRASRPARSAIWWRQLVPQAARRVSGGAARIFGSTPSSPIFSDIAWCSVS